MFRRLSVQELKGSAMEINPIAGMRAVAAVKSPKKDPQLFRVFDIENVIGSQQDSFSHNQGKMSGGQDDVTAEQESPEKQTQTADSGSTVSFFA
jgi:hypothetical protein